MAAQESQTPGSPFNSAHNYRRARSAAAAVLNRCEAQRCDAVPVLEQFLQRSSERQRTTDLVCGTIRNRAAIDMVIAKLGQCPADRIPAKLLNIIRIGVYELIYVPATAEYSIVNEAVENAKSFAGKKQAGFVNALLRQIARHIRNRSIPLGNGDAERTLPQTVSTGCEFDVEILPQPEQSPTDYFSAAFSLPKWLIADWMSELGAAKTRQICFASNRRPGIYLRANTLKTTGTQLAERLGQAGTDCEVANETMVRVSSPAAISELAGFGEGLFSVQDITAAQAVKSLDPKPGQTILDLCAAPGTKTTQIAELTRDSATIIATDIDNARLEKVKENVARLGSDSVTVIAYEKLSQTIDRMGLFDAVLLDVPCSNTGVLAKRIEARYRITSDKIAALTQTQSQLLEAAAKMIKPNGKICYSTCSIQESENGELVRKFLLKNRDLMLESEKLTLPSAEGFDRDGGYVAIIVPKTNACL